MKKQTKQQKIEIEQNTDFIDHPEKTKKRKSSKFSYNKAGGSFVPTEAQYDFCMRLNKSGLTKEQHQAINKVIFGYRCREDVHHDYIHTLNELIRKNENTN